MAPMLATALIAGGTTFALAKLSGADTGDSLKSAFLAGIGSYATGALGAGLNKAASDAVLTETIKSGGTDLLAKGVSASVPTGAPIAAGQGVYGAANYANVAANPSFTTSLMSKAGDYLSKPSKQFGAGLAFGGSDVMNKLNQPTGPKIDPNNPYNLTPEQRKNIYDKQYANLGGLRQTYDYSNDTPTTPSFMNTTPTFVNTQNMFNAKEGAFVEGIAQYATGGVNYLPSKIEKDENDVNNYVRATGYVEDGSGVGDKDEDTMLAQLADGEFVSRADAILGAGIMAGANPEDFKDMRKKGAAFFYNQQDRLKRVYDLVNA
tara:strand:+ start:40 stop:999 length:960 start_codon:yes stop_codon:yes gene_type:complete